MAEADDGIKLLLEAFQMSVSACLAHPNVPMLQAQLAGRLKLVRKTSQVSLSLSSSHHHVIDTIISITSALSSSKFRSSPSK